MRRSRSAVAAIVVSSLLHPAALLAENELGTETERERPVGAERDDAARDRDGDDRGQGAASDAASQTMVSETFIRRRRLSLLRHYVLAVPEYTVELMTAPLLILVSRIEEHALPGRTVDALESDDGTVSVIPRAEFSTGDAFGAGASLSLESRYADHSQLGLGFVYQINGDFDLGGTGETRIAALEGRMLSIEVEWEQDSSNDYHGIGATPAENARDMAISVIDTNLKLAVQPRGLHAFEGHVLMGFRRERLSAGSGGDSPVMEEGDIVAAPPGFGEVLHYGRLGGHMRLDMRDTDGRTGKGYVLDGEATTISDLDGRSLRALRTSATGVLYIPVLARDRRILVHAGAGGSLPLGAGAGVPLAGLVTLGQKTFLRGYSQQRFRARRAWWSGLEYHYGIWALEQEPVVLTSILFLDVGQVGQSVEKTFSSSFLYSYGGGLTLERFKDTFASLQVGRSPESVELIFATGGKL